MISVQNYKQYVEEYQELKSILQHMDKSINIDPQIVIFKEETYKETCWELVTISIEMYLKYGLKKTL